MKLAPLQRKRNSIWLIQQLYISGFHIVVSVASAAITANVRRYVQNKEVRSGAGFCCICGICCLRWFPLKNAVVSFPFLVVSVVKDRIDSISHNNLYPSFWAFYLRFPYNFICLGKCFIWQVQQYGSQTWKWLQRWGYYFCWYFPALNESRSASIL